jgi:uncharacterized surface protein with fasciclin (FAS1) repeats
MFHNRTVHLLMAVAAVPLALFVVTACGGTKQKTGLAAPPSPAVTYVNANLSTSTPFGAGCAAIPKDGPGSFAALAKEPVVTAVKNIPELSSLVTAVKQAGLPVEAVNTVKGFTVFAPTNDAFAKIPKSTLDAILADKTQLSNILAYHVVPQQINPDQLAAGSPYKSVQGGELKVSGSGTDFTVGNANAKVVCGNIQTGDVTLYLIDTVLMPS